MDAKRSLWLSLLGVFCLSLLGFSLRLNFPEAPDFDELHYIPAAKYFLGTAAIANREHPPLGKELIALGIASWGDTPWGWRMPSVIFGAALLTGVYLFALLLFQRKSAAAWVTLLTFSNHLLYVQSRIAMLDIFMFTFIFWALLLIYLYFKNSRTLFLYGAGFLGGLAMACKWSALIVWVFFGAYLIFRKYFQRQKPSASWPALMFAYGVIPLVVYFLCFLPYVIKGDLHLSEIFAEQLNMWQLQQQVSDKTHAYQSHWSTWLLMLRPMWYSFRAQDGFFRGIFLVGNPLVMWAGLGAMFYCAWSSCPATGKRRADHPARWISGLYALFYLSWAVVPRKLSFFYYYFPAATFLSFALIYCVEKLPSPKLSAWAGWTLTVLSLILFIYFLPVLSAFKIPQIWLNRWLWFSSWT